MKTLGPKLSMNHLGAIIVVPYLFFCANAEYPYNQHGQSQVGTSLAVVLSVLSAMVVIIFLILVFTKFCHVGVPHILTHSRRLSGIDKTVIESLPFFKFSSLKGSKEGLECVICIAKFKDTETLRLLPVCRHAFHMMCIDTWLENHSSCPLCRYKFDVDDLLSFNYTNSLRYNRDPSNLTEDPNPGLYVQREQDHQSSSRFNLGSSFRKLVKGKKEEPLIQEGSYSDDDRKLLHKFKHKILVSDIVHKRRWSDVNSSDLMFLNSEMLNVLSSKRFSPFHKNSEKFQTRSNSHSASSFPSTSNIKENQGTTSRSLNPAEKRSVSEISSISRFKESFVRERIEESLFSGNSGNDERMKRIWLSMARQTVHWFGGQERSSQESENRRNPWNV